MRASTERGDPDQEKDLCAKKRSGGTSTSFAASRGRGPAPSGNRDTWALALSVSDPYKMTLQNEWEKDAPVPPAEIKKSKAEVRHLPLGERICDDEIL